MWLIVSILFFVATLVYFCYSNTPHSCWLAPCGRVLWHPSRKLQIERMINGSSGCNRTGSYRFDYFAVTFLPLKHASEPKTLTVAVRQGSKAPIQELGDRVASVFVPCVVCLSLFTLTVWLTLTLSGVVPEDWYRDEPGSPGEERGCDNRPQGRAGRTLDL